MMTASPEGAVSEKLLDRPAAIEEQLQNDIRLE
jgi:hypothetical protein